MEQEGCRVSARKNFPAIEDLKTRFGKQILFTNRETLSAAEIVKIYLDRFENPCPCPDLCHRPASRPHCPQARQGAGLCPRCEPHA